MARFVLTVTLNPALDMTVIAPNFKLGQERRVSNGFRSAGGKGINVSRVLKTLKVPSITTGFLAGPGGSYIKQRLDDERINNDFCFIPGMARTNITIIDPVNSKSTRLLESGPGVGRKDLKVFLAKYHRLLKNCCLVVLSGSTSPGIPDSLYSTLISIAHKRNIDTVVDTSGNPLRLAIKAKPFMIKPNLDEAGYLLGKRLVVKNAPKSVKYLLRSGVGIVALTCGGDIAVCGNTKELFLGIPQKLKSRNLVGCGDAFIAGFIAGYLQNLSMMETFRLAVASGTANMLSINPGYLKSNDILRIIKKVRILPLSVSNK